LADEVAGGTQQKLEAMEGLHSAGSRPDIMIRIRKGSRIEVVFIESKVGSAEGDRQLSKYMDQLRALPEEVNQRSLVFITRDYEPKENLTNEFVRFFQARWSDNFYHFLALQTPNDTIHELLKFMKENNMSQSNRFSAIELLALTNHHRARSLMDATMWERVEKKFAKVCGATGSATKAMSQLRIHNRYVMAAGHGAGYQIEFLLGYWFPDEQPSDSPKVGMLVYVNPKAAERPAIVKAMLKFSEASNGTVRKWDNFDLGNDREWASIEMHDETRRVPRKREPCRGDNEVVRRVARRRGRLPKAESEAALECSRSRRGRQVMPRIRGAGCSDFGERAAETWRS
jgi:hypothetical protein